MRSKKARIDMHGIFGLAARPVPGFCVRAVQMEKPFLSETGLRSFLGRDNVPAKGMLPGAFAAAVIAAYLARPRARLCSIEERYRTPGWPTWIRARPPLRPPAWVLDVP